MNVGASDQRFGFVGLGTMGLPMATRLVQGGLRVVGFDIDDANKSAAQLAGVEMCDDPAVIGSTCAVVVTMLPTSAVVREALIGARPVLIQDCLTTLVVDMSSSAPGDTVVLAASLAARGIELVDAPVSGLRAKAVTGELTAMVGGQAAAVAGVSPLLNMMASTIVLTGKVGTGHATKALNNLLSATGLLAAAEILVAGAKFGIAPGVLIAAINASSGANHATLHKFGPHILSGSFDSGFKLALMAKDVRIAEQLMSDLASPHQIASIVADLIDTSLGAEPAGADHTEAVKAIERAASVELRHPGGSS